MDFSGFDREKLLPILINRTALFFFFMCLVTLLLYIAGTVHAFIDSTMLSLLRFYVGSGISLTVASISGIVLGVNRSIVNKKGRYLLRTAGYMLLAVFGTVTVLAVVFILTVSKGNMI